MPRRADPNLETVIISAATRLLDKQGFDAITMRDVAKAAGTTTPTLYERFSDRDALLIAVLDCIANDIRERMRSTRSVESIGEVFLDYCIRYPNRFILLHRVWPPTIATRRRRPTFELTVSRLRSQYGYSEKSARDIADAMISILLGTSVVMLGAGPKSKFAMKSRQVGLKALKAVSKGI